MFGIMLRPRCTDVKRPVRANAISRASVPLHSEKPLGSFEVVADRAQLISFLISLWTICFQKKQRRLYFNQRDGPATRANTSGPDDRLPNRRPGHFFLGVRHSAHGTMR